MEQKDIREALEKAFPAWLQVFITRFTGKALPGQKLPEITPSRHFFWAVTFYIVGGAIGIFGVEFQYPVCLIPSWILTVHSLRKMQLTIVHYCAHNTVFESKWANLWAGRIISLIFIFTEFDNYSEGHIRDHHQRNKLSTVFDPTVRFLIKHGIKPGLTRRQLWKTLIFNSFSPIFHFRVFFDRLNSHFEKTGLVKKLSMFLYLLTLFSFFLLQGKLWLFLLVFVFPGIVLYQICQQLRLVVEHRWTVNNSTRRTHQEFSELTSAVFLGSAPPSDHLKTTEKAAAWLVWSFEMTGHAFVRTCVMVTDTVCHDFHHYRASSKEWSNYQAARERCLVQKDFNQFTETWGLINTININFESFRNAKI